MALGRVLEVRLRPAGSDILSDLSNGSTTISVDDVTDFFDAGGTLTLEDVNYDYTSVDRDTNVITLSAAISGLQTGETIDAGTFAEVNPISNEKFALVLLDDLDPVLARVPHSLKDRLTDSIRDEIDQETVEVVIEGTEWVISDIIAVAQSLSSGYDAATHMTVDDDGMIVYSNDGVTPIYQVDSSTGTLMGQSGAFSDLGANTGSYDALSINDMSGFPAFPTGGAGGDLASDVLPHFGLGAIASGKGDGTTSPPNITSASSETVLYHFQTGPLYADRMYRITTIYAVNNVSGSMTSGTDYWRNRLLWQADDTLPVVGTATAVDNSDYSHSFGRQYEPVIITLLYSPSADLANGWFAVTALNFNGSGTMTAANGTTRQPQFWVDDVGPSADIGGVLDIAGSSSASSYTKTFKPTWGRSYNGDGSTFVNYGVETDDLYQGYWSGTHGNTKSAIGGFKINGTGATLASEVASSASNITKIKITWKVKHAGDGAGLDVSYGSHTDSTKRTTWGAITGKHSNQGAKNNCAEGSSYSVTLTSGSVFNQIASDLAAGGGLLFGPGPTTAIGYYGYLYGLNSTMPTIELTYLK